MIEGDEEMEIDWATLAAILAVMRCHATADARS